MSSSSCTDNDLLSFTAFNAPANAEKLQEVARKELGETEELKKECLQELRRLIKDNNVTSITSDDFLLRFLRTKKFQVQKSFKTLRNYSNQRAAVHKRLLKLQPETVKTFLRHGIFSILPYLDAEERPVFLHKSGVWSTDVSSEEELLMIIILIMNYLAERPSSQITGAIFIHDAKSIPLSLIPFVMRYGKFLMSVFFDSLPIRYPGIHIVNESFLLKYFLGLLDPLMPQKIKDRMSFHGSSREVLFQHINPTILPDDFGGSLGPLNNDHLVEEICSYLERMKDEQRYFL